MMLDDNPRMQTLPITFMTIFEASRLILVPQHLFYLILIGLNSKMG